MTHGPINLRFINYYCVGLLLLPFIYKLQTVQDGKLLQLSSDAFSNIISSHVPQSHTVLQYLRSEYLQTRSSESKIFINPLKPNVPYRGRTAPLTSKVSFYIFIQQIYVLYILNMVHTLLFFSFSKCSLFHNSNVFGSCIIHILYTGCAKIKTKNNSSAKRLSRCAKNLFQSCNCLNSNDNRTKVCGIPKEKYKSFWAECAAR